MKEEIPKIIKEVGFDFNWSEEKVWALDLPVEEMGISEIIWHFDIPFLWEKGVYNLKPQDVIDNPEAHKEEYERTMRADLVHPIDIMENKGRWLILDGLHRLMKASILGMKQVSVRKVPREQIPEIIKTRTDEELYEEAARVLSESGRVSIPLLQRSLWIGYPQAARLMDTLKEKGVVDPETGGIIEK